MNLVASCKLCGQFGEINHSNYYTVRKVVIFAVFICYVISPFICTNYGAMSARQNVDATNSATASSGNVRTILSSTIMSRIPATQWVSSSSFTILSLLWTCFILQSSPVSSNYATYVWRTGWDSEVPGCSNNPTEFYSWNTQTSPCFTHTWNTPQKRAWLWSTCSRIGRRITQIFLYDTQSALASRDCASPGIAVIKQTLTDGHDQGVTIFALFSDGGEGVPEQEHVPHVLWYNGNCAANPAEQIDGVAVNNENWDRGWDPERMSRYLDNLNNIRTMARGRYPGESLRTHFSVGWNWGKGGDGGDIVLTWGGRRQPVMRHFIDIFDSVDVQVAFITAEAMEERLRIAEWDYSVQQGKALMTTVYLNKDIPCQVTFLPFAPNDPDCPSWAYPYKTETEMWKQLDLFQVRMGSKVVLHHFRGAYSSGGDPNWPRY